MTVAIRMTMPAIRTRAMTMDMTMRMIIGKMHGIDNKKMKGI